MRKDRYRIGESTHTRKANDKSFQSAYMQSPRIEWWNRESADGIGFRGRILTTDKEVFIHFMLTHTNRLLFKDAIKRLWERRPASGRLHIDTVFTLVTNHLSVVQNSCIKIQVVTDLKHSLALKYFPLLAHWHSHVTDIPIRKYTRCHRIQSPDVLGYIQKVLSKVQMLLLTLLLSHCSTHHHTDHLPYWAPAPWTGA